MKRILVMLMLVAAAGGRLLAAGGSQDIDRFEQNEWMSHRPPPPPKVDTRKIVKASYHVLKDREPELTPDEYAVYEKVVTLLGTSPVLGMKLLQTLMGGKEKASPAFEFVLGNAYYEGNQMELAEKSYRAAVQDYPDFRRAWKNLGVLYYSTRRWPEAVSSFRKAIKLGDREASTLGMMGYCYEMQGDPITAETEYLQAVSLDPTDPDWLEGLLRIYLKAKQYDRAEPVVRRLLKEKPTETTLWLDYAGILISEQHKLEAIAVLETAEAAGVNGREVLSLLGDLYAEQGLEPEAAATYAKLLGPARSLGEHKLLYYAEVLIGNGRLTEAERTLAEVKGKVTPKGRIALLQARTDLATAKKQWPEARKEVESLLALEPLNGRALFTLGRIYMKQKDLPHASFALEQAARTTAYAFRANLELANIAVQNRQYARAAGYLEKALRVRQSSAVEDYLARIRALIPPDDKAG